MKLAKVDDYYDLIGEPMEDKRGESLGTVVDVSHEINQWNREYYVLITDMGNRIDTSLVKLMEDD